MLPRTKIPLGALAFYSFSAVHAWSEDQLPPQAVMINPLDIAVMGPNATFRTDTTTELFNPTNTTPPFFQVFDEAFLDILGSNSTIRAIATDPTFAFAHEAPIWDSTTDEVFFCSNDGGALGHNDINTNSQVFKISLGDVADAIEAANSSTSAVNITVTPLDLPDTIQMDNGGTGPFRGDLLLATSGRGPLPPSIVRVNPRPPYNATVLLDNFFGRQFNSLNDIKVHPTSGAIFFTDSSYGFINHFRPLPVMPNQVYRLDPDTRQVRVVADGFVRSNGIALTGDGRTAYVTDTGTVGFEVNGTLPATIYQFDIDPVSQSFTNRRVFAYADSGVPDGIQVDVQGNVFSGCSDGVQVWNTQGTLLGKFFLGTTSANMILASGGRLVIMAETAVYFAQIAAQGQDLASFGSAT
ncbi:unnamed protein product [Peniophora sp. CBMAI 1063]|nr:unnamed protein product [Peniophora sp. CBMAI 1063]